jgi:hypothetical protein
MPDNRTVTDEEKLDSDDNSWAGISSRLTRIVGIVQKANVRLDTLDPALQNPPDPVTPELRTTLSAARAEAVKLIDSIDKYIGRVPPPQ